MRSVPSIGRGQQLVVQFHLLLRGRWGLLGFHLRGRGIDAEIPGGPCRLPSNSCRYWPGSHQRGSITTSWPVAAAAFPSHSFQFARVLPGLDQRAVERGRLHLDAHLRPLLADQFQRVAEHRVGGTIGHRERERLPSGRRRIPRASFFGSTLSRYSFASLARSFWCTAAPDAHCNRRNPAAAPPERRRPVRARPCPTVPDGSSRRTGRCGNPCSERSPGCSGFLWFRLNISHDILGLTGVSSKNSKPPRAWSFEEHRLVCRDCEIAILDSRFRRRMSWSTST